MRNATFPLVILAVSVIAGTATEFHVAPNGSDINSGTRAAPLHTIQRAAELAQPGDVITVHAGTYRERVSPPRGGISVSKRITYQAAPGEKVEIKGSEIIRNWVKVQDNVWKVIVPNSFFANFNPYADLIRGDWFDPRGREHHTGAVYLNGEWLIEATKLEEVLMPGKTPDWLKGGSGYLLNVAWLRPSQNGEQKRIPATAFAAKQGTQNAPCSEGGECIGFIEHGNWVRYESIDFGRRTEQLEIRAASAGEGGIIEIRLERPDGDLLGTCPVSNTGDWQSWGSFQAKIKPLSGVKILCLVFRSFKPNALDAGLWFGQVDAANTTIWAQFKGVDPNKQLVEINVRRTVFYPDKPGRNYITVRGFTLRHAATPWAPPTAEQIGLIGTHWSLGWVIENNVVSHSICCGIALGKHGDEFDNTSANTAEGYVKTIERGHKNGWSKETIGHHVVRNNTISHCEQAGIVGSLGAAFCTVTANTIHDIHVRRLFSGAEMAGIKFHGAIDTIISQNHIYRTCLGLWLDWMAQGTQVSRNLFHDNAGQDMFCEVDHGPFVVDNNLFLSGTSLLDMSEGGAYAHNLFAGRIITRPEPSRETPYHPAHSTKVTGLVNVKGGDDRFYNNILVGKGKPTTNEKNSTTADPQWSGGFGLWMYDFRQLPVQAGGNVFYYGAKPCTKETNAIVLATTNPGIDLMAEGEMLKLRLNLGSQCDRADTVLVTTELLGKAKIPSLPYESADGSPLQISTDYFGKKRNKTKPAPGPFEEVPTGVAGLRVR